MPLNSHTNAGKVYLVGAGPGDPGLLTLRGCESLRTADVVVYDYLANPSLLRHTSPSAEKICLGRHGQGRIMSQQEVNQLLVSKAKLGKVVVRLKCGDPIVFAHYAAETTALRESGIEYEVIPGITTALAAGSYCGVPLTHRDIASSVALITAHQSDGKTTSDQDYRALANFPGTLVFYMGVTSIRHWTTELIGAGKSSQTPVAIVRRCTWPDQVTIRCRLGEVADIVESQRIRPPVIVIVGDVAGVEGNETWFTRRPLMGQCVLVTRPIHQIDGLRTPLEALGAEVLVQPTIQILPPDDWTKVDDALQRLPQFDWIVFSSANGVDAFMRRLLALEYDARKLGAAKIAAIGPATAARLEEYHLRADLIPNTFEAASLADRLAEIVSGGNVPGDNVPGGNVLLVRASRGREVLAERLRSAGAGIKQVVFYRSEDVDEPSEAIREALQQRQIDWVTVTSSAIARSLHKMLGPWLSDLKLASISPITSQTLRELGYRPTVEATEYTMPGLVHAMHESVIR